MSYGITVEETMSRTPAVINSGSTVSDAGKKMLDEDVGSLIVVDDAKIVGIITEKDIVRETTKNARDPAKTKVSEVMTRPVVTVSPETDLYDASITMTKRKIRRLPVEKDGRLVGMVTQRDVMRAHPAVMDIFLENMKIREPRMGPIPLEEPTISGVCESCGNYSDTLVDSKGMMVCRECYVEASK